MTMPRRLQLATAAAAALTLQALPALAVDYAKPQPLAPGGQTLVRGFKGSKGARIAYMPAATEFNYYIAIGEG